MSAIAIVSALIGALLLPVGLIAAAGFVAQGRTGLGLAFALLPQALLIGAFGLWKLRKWGLYTVMVALFMLGFVAVENILTQPAPPVVAVQALILLAALLGFLYLGHPRTRGHFA